MPKILPVDIIDRGSFRFDLLRRFFILDVRCDLYSVLWFILGDYLRFITYPRDTAPAKETILHAMPHG